MATKNQRKRKLAQRRYVNSDEFKKIKQTTSINDAKIKLAEEKAARTEYLQNTTIGDLIKPNYNSGGYGFGYTEAEYNNIGIYADQYRYQQKINKKIDDGLNKIIELGPERAGKEARNAKKAEERRQDAQNTLIKKEKNSIGNNPEFLEPIASNDETKKTYRQTKAKSLEDTKIYKNRIVTEAPKSTEQPATTGTTTEATSTVPKTETSKTSKPRVAIDRSPEYTIDDAYDEIINKPSATTGTTTEAATTAEQTAVEKAATKDFSETAKAYQRDIENVSNTYQKYVDNNLVRNSNGELVIKGTNTTESAAKEAFSKQIGTVNTEYEKIAREKYLDNFTTSESQAAYERLYGKTVLGKEGSYVNSQYTKGEIAKDLESLGKTDWGKKIIEETGITAESRVGASAEALKGFGTKADKFLQKTANETVLGTEALKIAEGVSSKLSVAGKGAGVAEGMSKLGIGGVAKYALGATLIYGAYAAFNNKGQQSNAQLYGQQPNY